jgi:hypothetical protein
MKWTTTALVVLSLVVSGLVVLGVRLSNVQAASMQVGLEARAEGRAARAIRAFRRVVRAHHPLAEHTEPALRQLLEMGAALEEEGDVEMARLAYASAWGGMNASTTYGTTSHPLAREAEGHLVRLRDGSPLPRRDVTARPQGKAAAALGLALLILSGFGLLRGRERAPSTRRLVVELSLFFAGLALFVVGTLHA